MNTPTPTPRTDAAWSATFDGEQMSAGRTARALRECSQQLETELAALRAVFPQICASLGNGAGCTPTVSVGFIESIPNEVQLVVDQLRADCENETKWAAHYLAQSIADKARAERAEADAAAYLKRAESFRKIGDEAEAELATEQARLDWLESPAGMHWQWQAGITRATIDAKMKEVAK